MSNRFHDLSFERLNDGTVRLIQQDVSERSVIDLHPAQLRHVAEAIGLVAPSYHECELTQLLADQLGVLYKELADECHRSHWLELTYEKLSGFMAAIPASIYPFHLWENETEKQADTANAAGSSVASMAANANSKAPENPSAPSGLQGWQAALELGAS